MPGTPRPIPKESFSQLIGESEAVYSRTADQHSSQTDGLTGICLFDHLGFNRSTSSDLMYIEQEIERGKAAEAGQLIRENGREGIGTLLGAAGRAG